MTISITIKNTNQYSKPENEVKVVKVTYLNANPSEIAISHEVFLRGGEETVTSLWDTRDIHIMEVSIEEANKKMLFDGEYREWGSIDISEIKREIETVWGMPSYESKWINSRASTKPAQRASGSIQFQWTPNLYDQKKFWVWQNTLMLESDLGGLYKKASMAALELLGGGKIIRGCIVRLPPGSTIPYHIDGFHESWTASHRVHLPIITEPEIVVFYESGTRKHFREGTLTEINNIIMHGVKHDGKNMRYHLMWDILPADYNNFPIIYHSDDSLFDKQIEEEFIQKLVMQAEDKPLEKRIETQDGYDWPNPN